jgi:hypothetical protein
MVSFYGRALGVAPVLGMLGEFKDLDDMDQKMRQYTSQADANNGDKGVIPALHLIYGLAIPCEPGSDCLLYFEAMDEDLVEDYIKPAEARGWHVILDTQMGRSDPVTQVQRMIDRGYLKYEHVHVALDPEFSSVPGRNIPGIPIGTLKAADINRVQEILNDYVVANGMRHKKILTIHQFGDANVNDGVPFMIENKETLKRFPNVDLVIDADGFGPPDPKISKYNRMTDSKVYPFLERRGIKIFYHNAQDNFGRWDQPVMDYETIFGHKETPAGYRIEVPPDLIVIG